MLKKVHCNSPYICYPDNASNRKGETNGFTSNRGPGEGRWSMIGSSILMKAFQMDQAC
jgi:hypothetical protein